MPKIQKQLKFVSRNGAISIATSTVDTENEHEAILDPNKIIAVSHDEVSKDRQYKSTTKNKAAQNRWFKKLTISVQPVSKRLEDKCALSHWYQIEKSQLTEEEIKQLRQYLTLEPTNAHIFRAGGHATSEASKFSLFKETEKNVLVPRFFGISHWGVPKHDFTTLGEAINLQFGGKLLNDPPQVRTVNTMLTALKNHNHGGCLSVPCGFGKCWGKGTEFLMFDGSVKVVEDLEAGDKLMGDDNKPRNILSTTQGMGQMFRIVPNERSPAVPFECNDEHILVLKMSIRPYIKKITPKKYRKAGFKALWFEYDPKSNLVYEKTKKFSYPTQQHKNETEAHLGSCRFLETVPNIVDNGFLWEPTVRQFLSSSFDVQKASLMYMPGRITFTEKEGFFRSVLEEVLCSKPTDEQVKAASWLVGAWIGDSNSQNPYIWVSIHENDMLDECFRVGRVLGCDVSMSREKDMYCIRFIRYPGEQKGILQNLLEKLGVLKNKHVPDQLLFDEIEFVRLPLLAGLLDTDGHFLNSSKEGFTYEFVQLRKQIVESIHRLANLTGFRSNKVREHIIEVNGKNKSYWRSRITGPNLNDLPLITLRKQCPKLEHPNKHHLTWSFKIETLGIDEYFGFSVDGNRRMLMKDLTVTHNTVCAAAMTATLGRKTLFVCHRGNLMEQARTSFEKFLPGVKTGTIRAKIIDVEGKDVVFATIQTLISKDIDQSILDQFGFLIVDECHHIAAQSFCQLSCKVRCRYIVGLSATLGRRDGLECAIHWQLGPTIVHENRTRTVVDVDVKYYNNPKTQKDHKVSWGPQRGKTDYNRILSDMINDRKRNEILMDWVIDTLQEPKRKIVVQSKQKRHLDILHELLLEKLTGSDLNALTREDSKNTVTWIPSGGHGKPIRLGYYTGDFKNEEQREALQCDVIFATAQMMEEGVDEPTIDTVVFATPIGNVTQSAGRALRLLPEKNIPKFFYLFDNFSLWIGMGNKAISYFKGEHYRIEII